MGPVCGDIEDAVPTDGKGKRVNIPGKIALLAESEFDSDNGFGSENVREGALQYIGRVLPEHGVRVGTHVDNPQIGTPSRDQHPMRLDQGGYMDGLNVTV
jgi:hypothetical protein